MPHQNPDDNLEERIRNLQEQANQISDETIKKEVMEQLQRFRAGERIPIQPSNSEEERIWRLVEGPVIYYIDGDSVYSMESGQVKELTKDKAFVQLGGLILSPDKKRLAFHAANPLSTPIPVTPFIPKELRVLDSFKPRIRRIYIGGIDSQNLKYIDDQLNAWLSTESNKYVVGIPEITGIPLSLDCHNPRWTDNQTLEYNVDVRKKIGSYNVLTKTSTFELIRTETHGAVLKANNDISTGPFKVI